MKEIRRVPVNKWCPRGNTIQAELKLRDATIKMLKEHIRIHLDNNEFNKMHESTTKLVGEIKEYNRIHERM